MPQESKEIQKRETRRDPWTDLDRMFDEMRDRVSEVWDLRPFGMTYAPFEREAPDFFRAARTDVSDTGTAFKVVAEVPGIPKDKLDIRIRGTSVEIRGESATKGETRDGQYVHRERTYAGFYRHLELPEPVVAADAKAKVENGVLELELPKEHPASGSEVKVSVQ